MVDDGMADHVESVLSYVESRTAARPVWTFLFVPRPALEGPGM